MKEAKPEAEAAGSVSGGVMGSNCVSAALNGEVNANASLVKAWWLFGIGSASDRDRAPDGDPSSLLGVQRLSGSVPCR